jgi:3-hydroxyisobutyrate dehydrogenase-like beta-hydroxyacid dehydrogenase
MSTIIIGSGGMGAAIGGLAAKAGHTVEVMSRDPAKARALAEQVGAGATTETFGAAPAGDIFAGPRRPLRQKHQFLTRRQPSGSARP